MVESGRGWRSRKKRGFRKINRSRPKKNELLPPSQNTSFFKGIFNVPLQIFHFLDLLEMTVTDTSSDNDDFFNKEITLDISRDVDERLFEVLKQLPHGIPTHTYLPLKNYNLIAVVDNNVPIWIYKYKGDICTKVSVSSRDGPKFLQLIILDREGNESFMYFLKDGNSWIEVGMNTFFSKFDLWGLNQSILEYVTLNVSSEIDRSHFHLNESPNLPYKIAVPSPGYVLSRIFDGINTIWKSSSYDQHCPFVIIFTVDDKPLLLHLMVFDRKKESMLFFKKVLLSWKEISKEEYIYTLNGNGFNPYKFQNNISFDFLKRDKNKFTIQRNFNLNVVSEIFTPLPGFSVKRVEEGSKLIWESNGLDQCIFLRFYSRNAVPVLCHLLITDCKDNKILYFMRNEEYWVPVEKSQYYHLLSNKDDPIYTHRNLGVDENGDRKLIMSHFRNKQGLLIRTYCSKVENPKGNIILIHGSWGHFKSQFCTYDMDWHYQRFGYPILPYMKDFTSIQIDSFFKPLKSNQNSFESYNDFFGWTKIDGEDALKLSGRFQYSGTFLEALNNMGYNVYGMDLQSHGLSESNSGPKFYLNDIKDYVNDVLQFIDIVKRGKFSNTDLSWNEELVYNLSCDNVDQKCYLSGYSLGANIVIQSVQEFYKMAKPGVKLVDGVFVLSGMFNMVKNLETFANKLLVGVIKFVSLMTPRAENVLENPYGSSDSFEMFSRYKDPTYYNDRLFFKTVEMLFGSCKEVFKNLRYYPDKLPTLFIHVSDDPLYDVNGKGNVVYNSLKNKSNVKLVELKGNSHHLTLSHFVPNVTPIINDWFLSNSSKSSLIYK